MTDQDRNVTQGPPAPEVRPLTPDDASAVVELLEHCRSTWIHSEGGIRGLAGNPPHSLVAVHPLSGELLGFLACGQTGERLSWIRDLCVACGQPWERVAGALVDSLPPEWTYEVIVRESDRRARKLFRSRGFAGDQRDDHVVPNAFGDIAGVVMRRVGTP